MHNEVVIDVEVVESHSVKLDSDEKLTYEDLAYRAFQAVREGKSDRIEADCRDYWEMIEIYEGDLLTEEFTLTEEDCDDGWRD